jgi:hypothetical protein
VYSYRNYARDWTTLGFIPGGGKRCSFLQNVQADSRATPPLIQWILAFFVGGKGACLGVTFTTYVHLTPSFRMSGAIPLRPRHAFMSRTGRTLPFCLLATCKKFPYPVRQKTWTFNMTPMVLYSVQPGRSVPTFQRNLMPLSCGWIMETGLSETSVHFCHTAQRDIS